MRTMFRLKRLFKLVFLLIVINIAVYFLILPKQRDHSQSNLLDVYDFYNSTAYPRWISKKCSPPSAYSRRFSFCLTSETTLVGHPFDRPHFDLLEYFRLNFNDASEPYPWTDEQILNSFPTLVTAFSENHVSEALEHLESWLAVVNDTSDVVIYDLGFSHFSRAKFTRRFESSQRRIKIKHFNFTRYPNHVQNLGEYRFKPLAIAEALRDYPSVIWVDSSVRLHSNMSSFIYNISSCMKPNPTCQIFPFVLLSDSGHSIFAATHPNMVKYLPIEKSTAIRMQMFQAAPCIVYATSEVRNKVLRWLVLCSLEQQCLAPDGHYMHCHIKSNDVYGECHRYDQAALNILLGAANKYESTKYVRPYNGTFMLKRNQRYLDVVSSWIMSIVRF